MSLNLDPRQRAMLAELGLRVWWPEQADVFVSQPAIVVPDVHHIAIDNVAINELPVSANSLNHQFSSEPARVRQPIPGRAALLPGPASLLALPAGIASMDWAALSAAVSGCQACQMCLGRQAAVFVPPPQGLRCDWLVLGEPPDDAQERAGQPFVDDAGKLLDNMLKAAALRRAPSFAATAFVDVENAVGMAPVTAQPPMAYLSHVLKCRPARPTAPDAAALATCAHYLQREIALLQPKVILAMGRFAMQVLLSQDHPGGLTLPLGKLRGRVWHYQGVPVVVTYPPAYLLRHGQDKARAWADLCLALDVVQGVDPPG